MSDEATAARGMEALILDSLPMGVLFCDRGGIVRFINRAYAEALGSDPASIAGKAITDVIPHSRAREVMESGKEELGDLCHLGSSRTLIVNRLPARDGAGAVIGMISQAIFRAPEDLRSLAQRIERRSRRGGQQRRANLACFAPRHTFASILGKSEAMERLKQLAQKISQSSESCLILGGTGVGKEMFAHAIHAASPAGSGPLVCINCASVPRELFESELFGYERGAFSNARQEGKPGQIEMADGGSLFLDEIGDLPLDIQAKLLRVLETRVVARLGAVSGRRVEFRILAATSRDLAAMVKCGAFREDLYYRLNAFILEIPPLRERRGDILPIALAALRERDGAARFGEAAQAAMLAAEWPGNCRQLRNAVIYAAAMRRSEVISPEDFPASALVGAAAPSSGAGLSAPGAKGLALAARHAEARAIEDALLSSGGNVSAAARALGVSRVTLYEKMRKFAISAGRARPSLGAR